MRGRIALVPWVRAFKTKATEAARKQKQAAAASATGGRDPYSLFKEALTSPRPSVAEAGSVTEAMRDAEWKQHRAAYSREKMAEVCQ